MVDLVGVGLLIDFDLGSIMSGTWEQSIKVGPSPPSRPFVEKPARRSDYPVPFAEQTCEAERPTKLFVEQASEVERPTKSSVEQPFEAE